jgi:hypothetical protein
VQPEIISGFSRCFQALIGIVSQTGHDQFPSPNFNNILGRELTYVSITVYLVALQITQERFKRTVCSKTCHTSTNTVFAMWPECTYETSEAVAYSFK